jgi:CrcB protein
LASTWLTALLGHVLPWGTLLVNTLGSFVVVLVMQLSFQSAAVPPDTRIFLCTGLMGGFTTYSSFNYETLYYLQQGQPWLAAANVASTVIACLLAGFSAVWVVRVVTGGG